MRAIGWINRYQVYPFEDKFNVWDTLRGRWCYESGFSKEYAFGVCRDLTTSTGELASIWYDRATYPMYHTATGKLVTESEGADNE